MTKAEDVPLICDPVPGPPLLPGVLVANRVLSEAEIARFKAEWERVNRAARPVYIVADDCQMYSIFDDRQWPDAEFCAA